MTHTRMKAQVLYIIISSNIQGVNPAVFKV